MKINCGILNFWNTNNYGALLTCYALQQTIKSMGYNVSIINFRPWADGLSSMFSSSYLNITDKYTTYNELVKLNNYINTFIVGSDQVWRYKYSWHLGKTIYYLDFASPDSKKISCAASFGQDYFEGSVEDISRIKYYLNKFDYISVREDSGVDLCKSIFGVNATHILDPVFFLDSTEYDILIKKSNLNEKKFYCYICA